MKLSKENIKNYHQFQYIFQFNKTFQEVSLYEEYESKTFILRDWFNNFTKSHYIRTVEDILNNEFRHRGYIDFEKLIER